jgi:S1-C subfamily serine protease
MFVLVVLSALSVSEEFAPYADSVVRVQGVRPGVAFVVDAERGIYVTAAHVVGNAKKVKIHAPSHEDGRHYVASYKEASVIEVAPHTDLAVLRQFPAPVGLKPLKKTAYGPGLGEDVITIGFDGSWKVIHGTVKASPAERPRGLQNPPTDGSIHTTLENLPGFSGGPIINAKGVVIGINAGYFQRGEQKPGDLMGVLVLAILEALSAWEAEALAGIERKEPS